MKKMRKMMTLALAMVMVLAMGVRVMAAKITINRDSTWDKNAESAEATYTYYKIFDAKDIDQKVDAATGEQAADSNKVAVYTLDSVDKVNALPTGMFKANNKATGSLTAADATDDGLFYITLADESTSAANIATALKTMVDNNTTLFPGTDVTSAANPVVINNLAPAYYLIKASNGSVLAVQTLDDVTINEKNDYPKVDKKQKKEADPTYTEAEIPAEIGTYIDYQITVTVPANANKDIIVVDKMTAGLDYDETTGLTFDPDISGEIANVATTDEGYAADATWQIKIPAATVEAHQGDDIVITYRAQVTADALTDTGRENEVTLTYDEGNYVLKDTTTFTTYFGGIYKIDPKNDTADMSGVKFELTDGDGNAVNVTYDSTNGYYVVDAASTRNEVETRVDGNYYTIKIRGFDDDKTYKLTETATVTGYNLLEGDVTLTLTEDKGTAFADKLQNTFDKVENNKGSVLPSTGGIGTTIFYIVGAILVLGAGIVMVSKRRMDA